MVSSSEYVEELHDLRYWLTVDRFDRTTVDHPLRRYTGGDAAWQWEGTLGDYHESQGTGHH